MQITASEFSTRDELEKHVATKYGKTAEKKGHTVNGTVAELNVHMLRHGQSLWGIPVVASDYQPREPFDKPSRGKKSKSTLNGTETSVE